MDCVKDGEYCSFITNLDDLFNECQYKFYLILFNWGRERGKWKVTVLWGMRRRRRLYYRNKNNTIII